MKEVNNIENILNEYGAYIGTVQGDSMMPMLVQGRDRVVIETLAFPPKKYDVVLYRRNGRYVLHRIIKVTKKGYLICGDNRVFIERDIKGKDIIGILKGFFYNGKYIEITDEKYLKYAEKVCRTRVKRKLIFYKNAIIRKIKNIRAK